MKTFCITTVCLIIFSSLAMGQKSKHLYADFTIASRSIWHGWDINSNNGAVMHPCLEYSIAKSGLSIAAWASLATDRNLNANDDIEFLLKYQKELLSNKISEIKIKGFADYILNPNTKMITTKGLNTTKMLWKYNLGIAFTNLITLRDNPIIPEYNIYYIRPFGDIDFKDGSIHEIGLSYTIPILTDIKIANTLNYHTGVFDGGAGWTHATSQIYSAIDINKIKLSATINKQWSFNKRSDINDEFWISIGISSSF